MFGPKGFTTSAKLALLVVMGVVCLAGVMAVSAVSVRGTLDRERRSETRHVVEVAFGVLQRYADLARRQVLTEAEAQAGAISEIASLRYGHGDYFWINDLRPYMVMHPFKPELNGTDLSGFVDPNGRRIFVEFVETAKRGGEGFVDYLWPKPGASEPVRKVSFVKAFEPWGWIIGTGIYVDDVDAAFAAEARRDAAVLGAIALMFAVVAWLASRSIVAPLGAEPAFVADIANRVADGDLDIAGADGRPGTVLHAMRRMVHHLASTIGEVRNGAETLSAASQQLSATAATLSHGTGEQAASTQAATASLEQIRSSISQTAESSRRTERMALAGAGDAEASGTSVQATVAAMSEIAGKIKIIDEIAYRTNLLALNAAIEAGRAGVHGRGFLVVAAEVRRLAERARLATREIGDVAERSLGVAERSGTLIHALVPAIRSTADLVLEVAAAAQRQAEGVQQVSDAMSSLEGVTQRNANAADELSSTAEEMASQAEALTAAIGYFRLDRALGD